MENRLLLRGLAALALLTASAANSSGSTTDTSGVSSLERACWTTLEGCKAYWNVYASLADGGVWYQDKMGTDPRARAFDASLNSVINRLERCGIRSAAAPSRWFQRFTPNLAVVFSGPFAQAGIARRELGRARACGIAGYTKYSEFYHVGND